MIGGLYYLVLLNSLPRLKVISTFWSIVFVSLVLSVNADFFMMQAVIFAIVRLSYIQCRHSVPQYREQSSLHGISQMFSA